MYPTKPRAKLTLKTILPTIIGLVIFFLYVLLYNVNISEVILIVKNENLGIFSAAIIASIGEVFFDVVSWQALLSNLKVKISLVRSFLYTLYSLFIDTIIPFEGISADLVKIYLVNREQNGTSGKVVASVVIKRIITMGTDIVMLILGVAFVFRTTQFTPLISNLILFFTAALILVLAILLLFSWKESWSARIIIDLVRVGEFLSRKRWKQKLDKIKGEALDAAKTFHDSMKESRRNPLQFMVPTLFLILRWVSNFAVPYLVFLSLGLHISWTVIFITSYIVTAVNSVSFGISQIGLPEITMVTVYNLMGISVEMGIAATILSRILTCWLRFGIGFIAQQWVELKRWD